MRKLKKFLCAVLSAAIVLTPIFPVAASDRINVTINGNPVYFDVPPMMINDRTMVPLRAIFEALGASVDWNEATQTVTSSKDGSTIMLTINSTVMYVNGTPITLDVPAQVVNDRTLVPIRAISEAYNTTVNWDDSTQTVIITTNSQIPVQPEPTAAPIVTVPVEDTPFDILKNSIISRGIYNDGSYSVLKILDNNLSLFFNYNPTDDKIGLCVFSDDTKFESGILLRINLSKDPDLILNTESKTSGAEATIMGDFSSPDHTFTVISSNVPYNVEASGIDLINTSLELIDTYLSLDGFGVTLADFGISYSK